MGGALAASTTGKAALSTSSSLLYHAKAIRGPFSRQVDESKAVVAAAEVVAVLPWTLTASRVAGARRHLKWLTISTSYQHRRRCESSSMYQVPVHHN
jgi:hypothetical protein